MNIQYKWLLIILAFGFIACESDDDTPEMEEVVITSGEADFSKFVSIGNSLTAGFTDGALFIAAQENSLPNIMSQQFALAGGGDFLQPLMNDNIGGALLGGTPILNPRFFFNGSGPALLDAVPTTEITAALSGSFNNMGIPGAKSFHLVAPGYGNVAGLTTMPATANPYFVRIASDPAATVLGDAMAQSPTFFSLWIGNNDVLGYALSGGDGSDPITDDAIFTQVYNTLVTTLTSGGAKGVAFNIPDVTAIAHFTTVPHNPLDPLDEDNPTFGMLVPTLNVQFAGLNQVFTALGVPERAIVFATDENSPVVIKDESLTDLSAQITGALQMAGVDAGTAAVTGFLYGQARPANENDLLVLPSSAIIGQVNTTAVMTLMGLGLSQEQAGQLAVNGVTFPLEDKWVLIPSEQQEIATATATFNGVIDAAVQQAGLAFVDANALLDQVSAGGIQFDEFLMQGNLVFGGLFSLDGVHPTARGYAFLANSAASAINTTYGSNLPLVKAVDYPLFYSAMLQ